MEKIRREIAISACYRNDQKYIGSFKVHLRIQVPDALDLKDLCYQMCLHSGDCEGINFSFRNVLCELLTDLTAEGVQLVDDEDFMQASKICLGIF